MRGSEPDRDHLTLLDAVRFQPVFILGMHRSGTTLLYRLLQQSGAFNVVTFYHVARYNELLENHVRRRETKARAELAGFCRQQGIRNRVIDALEVNPDLPEEYGFILRNSSNSPYIDSSSQPKFVELCKKIQLISESSKPLLLKNPGDYDRFMFIHQQFPNAKFIFIHRDPIRTIDSHLRAIRAVFGKRSAYQCIINHSYKRMFDNPLRLWSSRLRVSRRLGLDLKRVSGTFARKADYLVGNIGQLPPAVYHEVTYEKLNSDTDATIAGILEFLGLGQDGRIDFGAQIRPRERPLLSEVEKSQSALRQRYAAYCSYCGYGPD